MQAVCPGALQGSGVVADALEAGAPGSARARQGRRPGVLAAVAIALMCLCTYAPTIHLRSHYSDDYANRMAVERSNWWGACQQYWDIHGLLRPLGLAAVLLCQQGLWEYPVAQQAIMAVLCVLLCLLVYLFALRVTGDRSVALAAGAILAAWPSYTSMVVWVAGGLEMLPAYASYLAALLLYLRHVGSCGTCRWWIASLMVFALSVTFHDQHLGAVAAFSVLACLCSPAERRVGLVLGTIPFWLVAVAVGLTTMMTARGTERPLEPAAAGFLASFGTVVQAFWSASLGDPIRQCLYGAGPRESLSRMAVAHPALLVGAGATLVAATGLTISLLRRIQPPWAGRRRLATLAVAGVTIVLAGLGIMALQESASIKPRHTLVPAIGLAMILASALGALGSRRGRSIGGILLGCLLLGLSVFRLGYAYEWTTRTRVTEQLLASLDGLYPTARSDDLLVIDGVRKYGRGFADSWGLSGAVSLGRGVPVRVATLVRREGDRLYGNAAWDQVWEIDPAAARFFVWQEARGCLRAATYEEFLARRPDLQHAGP